MMKNHPFMSSGLVSSLLLLVKVSYAKETEANILVIGSPGSGKSSVIEHYVEGNAEILADYTPKKVFVNGEWLNLKLWEVPTQDLDDHDLYIPNPLSQEEIRSAVVVLDASNLSRSWPKLGVEEKTASRWTEYIANNLRLRNGEPVPVYLFLNKWDLRRANAPTSGITMEQISNYYCNFDKMFRTGTEKRNDRENIKKGLDFIAAAIVQKDRDDTKWRIFQEYRRYQIYNLVEDLGQSKDSPPKHKPEENLVDRLVSSSESRKEAELKAAHKALRKKYRKEYNLLITNQDNGLTRSELDKFYKGRSEGEEDYDSVLKITLQCLTDEYQSLQLMRSLMKGHSAYNPGHNDNHHEPVLVERLYSQLIGISVEELREQQREKQWYM